MQTKLIPVITKGYTSKFFTIDISEEEVAEHPHIRISCNSNAVFALELDDDGLNCLGIIKGDYLLFTQLAPLRATGQICLIHNEDEHIIREAHWSSDTTILRVPGDIYEPIEIPTENIRIMAVLDNVIKPYDGLNIVNF